LPLQKHKAWLKLAAPYAHSPHLRVFPVLAFCLLWKNRSWQLKSLQLNGIRRITTMKTLNFDMV